MTVKIGEMTATFSSANTIYVAVGMQANDQGSHANSKLLNLSVNAKSQFAVYKDGSLRVRDYLYLTPNSTTINVDTAIHGTTYVKSYSEGYATANTSNGNIFLNLNEASVFSVSSSNNAITKITFIKPTFDSINSISKMYSCSVIFRNITSIANSAWSQVDWPSGTPLSPSGNTSIFTFFSNPASNSWYAINSGQNFLGT